MTTRYIHATTAMNCAQASSDKASRGAGGSLLRHEGDRRIFTITNVHEPLLQNTCFELGDSGQTVHSLGLHTGSAGWTGLCVQAGEPFL